jgi:hypothetical protein
MNWVTNSWDYRQEKYRKFFHAHTYEEWCEGPEAIKRAFDRHMKWFNTFIVGPPKSTEIYTSEYLAKEGMIGLYVKLTREEWITEQLRKMKQPHLKVMSTCYPGSGETIIKSPKVQYY